MSTSAKKPVRKRGLVSRIALAIGSALLFVLMLLIAAYFALRSPWVYDKLKPELVARLQTVGVQLDDPGSLQLDLLRSITLKNAKLRWSDSKLGDADLLVGNFEITYSLAPLLRGRLQIDTLTLRDVDIKSHLLTPAAENPPPPAEPMDLAQLETLLESPPLPITIKALQLENIHFDIRLDDQQQWQHLQGHLQQAAGNVTWQSELLQGNFQLMLDQRWLLAQGQGSGAEEIRFTPALNGNVGWNLTAQDGRWQLRDASLDHDLKLQAIEASKIQGSKKTSLGKIESLNLRVSANASSQEKNSTRNGLAAIFPLKLRANVDDRIIDLALNNFSQDKLNLDLLANQNLTLTLQGSLQPFNAKAPPLALTAKQNLMVTHLDADYQGQQATLEDLNLETNLSGDVPWNGEPLFPLEFTLGLDGQAKSLHLLQPSEGSEQPGIEASFSPDLKLAASGTLRSVDNWLQTLTLHFEPELTTRKLELTLGEGKQAERYRVDAETFKATGDLDQGQLSLAADLGLGNARIPQILRKFSLQNHLQLATDLALKQPNIDLQMVLNKKPLADISIQADNRPDTLSLRSQVKANLTSRLKRLHSAAAVLDTTGNVKIDWDGDLKLQHGSKSLLDADFSQLTRWPFEHQGKLGITQTRKPRDPAGIRLTAPVQTSYGISTENSTNFKTHLHLNAPGVQTPPLVKPIPLQVWDQATFDWPLKRAKTNGTLRIAGTDTASFRLSASNKPRQLVFDSRWTLNPRARLKKYLPALAALENVGGITTAHWLKGKLNHPNRSILDISASQLQRLRASLTLDTHITQASGQPGTTLQLAAPIDLNQTLHWSGKDAQLTGDFSIESAQASEQISLQSLAGSFQIGANSGLHPDGGKFALQIRDGSLILHETGKNQTTATNLKQVLVPLNLSLSARQTGNKLFLDAFRLQTGGDFLDLEAKGEATLDGKNAQVTSTLTTRLRPDLLVNPYLSGAGSMRIPWRLVLLGGDQISVDGKIRFEDLDVTTRALQLQGLDGSLKIEEELLWTGKQLKFRYLEDPDPFQRVDFTRIQPFLDNRESLRVLQITAGEKTVGPGLASLQFKQNVLHLQQLDLDLFGGHLTGQVYLDTRPGNWKVGLLSRITQLDPRQLLAKGSAAREGEYAPVSARTALEFDIRQRLLQGRIDITKISRDQLFQLLEVIDPEYKDEQIAQLRAALRVAYPQKLSIDMQQGLLNLEAKVSALPTPLRIRGLPLTPLIQHFAGIALETLGKLPLEQEK